MNYEYFARMEAGELCPADEETDQAFMERVLTAVLTEPSEELKGSFNDMFHPQLCACSAADRSLTVTFPAEDWMRNPNGTLHGGVSAAAVDIVMSVMTRFFMKKRTTVTVQLNTNFLKVIPADGTFTVHAVADHAGRRCVMIRAVVTGEASNKPAVTASGVLM